MTAVDVTRSMGPSLVGRLANLQKLAAGSAPVNIGANATTTITIEHTAATGAITIDYAETAP